MKNKMSRLLKPQKSPKPYFDIKPEVFNFIPRLQSHRGYRESGQIENTLGAVQKAYELGYEMCEFDVRISRDRIPVLFHDAKVENHSISKTLYKNLKSKFNIDSLEDVFKWFETTEKWFKLNIEIKSIAINGKIEQGVYKLIRQYKLEDRVLISSFNPFTLSFFRKKDPRIVRSLLLTFEKRDKNNFIIRKMLLNKLAAPHALHLRFEDFDQNLFKDLEIPIVLWTCNEVRKIKSLYTDKKIHGIISDTIQKKDLVEL